MKEVNAFHLDAESQNKLTFEQAKELYIKATNTTDPRQKKEYMDRLIVGTLYFIHNYIQNNGLKILENSLYDIEDIQSTFTEIWIKRIREGELLKCDSFAKIIFNGFLGDVANILVGDKVEVRYTFDMQSEDFVNLLFDYIQLKNTGRDFDVEKLIFYYVGKRNKNCYCDCKLIYEVIDSIYNNIKNSNTDDLNISRNRLREYIKLFISSNMQERLSGDIVSKDMYEKAVKESAFEHFSDAVDNSVESEKERIVIHEKYGLDGENRKNTDEIAREFGVDPSTIRKIEFKALHNLRGSKDIRQYADDFDVENKYDGFTRR